MAKILIVEDNPLNLKLASVILRAEGHEILGAADAVEARRIIARGIPELILMDLGLPGTDGYTLTRELRGLPATQAVPIVAVTSFAMKGDQDKAVAAGCTGYLTKPIDRGALIREVASQLSSVARMSRGSVV